MLRVVLIASIDAVLECIDCTRRSNIFDGVIVIVEVLAAVLILREAILAVGNAFGGGDRGS